MGSPLALRWHFAELPAGGWDVLGGAKIFDDALTMARNSDPTTLRPGLRLVLWSGIFFGVLQRRRLARCARCEEALAERRKATAAISRLIFAKYELGAVLLNRADTADRSRGLELMMRGRTWMRERIPSLVPLTELWPPGESGGGDRDAAITRMRKACDEICRCPNARVRRLRHRVLVEALLERGRRGRSGRSPRRPWTSWRVCAPDEALGDSRRLAAAVARADGPRPRRRHRPPRLRDSLSRHGDIAWTSKDMSMGRGHDDVV